MDAASGARPTDRPLRSAMCLLALLTGIAAFAVGTCREAERADPSPSRDAALIDEDFAQNTVLGHIVATGALVARPRPETLRDPPPARRGMLRFEPAGAPAEAWPSTGLARAIAAAHPERDFVSIAVDPRDWDDPDVGIVANAERRGDAWIRGACVTLFHEGRAVAEGAAGVGVHGDSSRRHARKSLRLHLTPRFGATVRPSRLLPGALGDSLVLHNDRRRLCFVNPIGYELLRQLGVDAPRTRPVRLLVNGELLPGIFFVTERLDESHLAARSGSRRVRWFQERDGRRPRDYRRLVLMLRDRAAERVPPLDPHVDVDAALGWIVGVLLLAPYDCQQGVAYQRPDDRRWRWIAWDVDWGLGPWPEAIHGSPLEARDVVEYLARPDHYDLRGRLFAFAMTRDVALRRQLLARLRDALDHRAPYSWWQATLARYREHTERLLDPDERRFELDSLESIDAFVRARPAALRRELDAAFALGRPHRIEIRVPDGASVSVDGHRHEGGWSGHAFAGEHVQLAADPPFVLRIPGEPDERAATRRVLEMTGPVVVEVVHRSR